MYCTPPVSYAAATRNDHAEALPPGLQIRLAIHHTDFEAHLLRLQEVETAVRGISFEGFRDDTQELHSLELQRLQELRSLGK
jgi:hypothetical protein